MSAHKVKAKRKAADKLRGTAEKRPNPEGVPFKPGYDPRRNYKGRPKSHDELREMIRNIGAEVVEVTTTAGERYKAPLAYFMLRDMFTGRDARDHQNIIEHGWGKVPQDVTLLTWQSELVEALKQGKLSARDVIDGLGFTDEARAILVAAGTSLPEGTPGDAEPGRSGEHGGVEPLPE